MPLLGAEEAQLHQLFLVGELLQSFNHLCCPPLDLLQQSHAHLKSGGSNLGHFFPAPLSSQTTSGIPGHRNPSWPCCFQAGAPGPGQQPGPGGSGAGRAALRPHGGAARPRTRRWRRDKESAEPAPPRAGTAEGTRAAQGPRPRAAEGTGTPSWHGQGHETPGGHEQGRGTPGCHRHGQGHGTPGRDGAGKRYRDTGEGVCPLIHACSLHY